MNKPTDTPSDRVALYAGDCMAVLADMGANTVDSVVTDPPYHFTSIVNRFSKEPPPQTASAKRYGKTGGADRQQSSVGAYARHSKGFMGQTWDGGDIAFRPELWGAVKRVLRPGGYVLAFAATRNYHRMACAIEDAGFVIRDQIGWVYGCLTADAEILTEHGWRAGLDVRSGERVAGWDPVTGDISLQAVEQTFAAPYHGNLVRFANDDTDQALTPNHRVYYRARRRRSHDGRRQAWYERSYEVAQAANIARWNGIKLPLAGCHDGPGIGGIDYAALLGWIWTEGSFDRTPSTGVRIYQSTTANATKVAEINALLAHVVPSHKRYDRDRTYVYGATVREYAEACWFFTGEMAMRVRADLPSKHPSWELLWRMTLAEKRAFFDAAMKGDGSGDDFYQKDEADLVWFQALAAMIGCRGKLAMRKAPRDGGSVCITPRDTTELQSRHLVNATMPYSGMVWCVTVATGAFVARRNGKIFITGNSGFPKSHNVSKAVDRMLGAERKKLGERALTGARVLKGGNFTGGYDGKTISPTYTVTGPGSRQAQQWEGWGTALKPAWEPIVVAQKPMLDDNVAKNVLRWGNGAMNIDGCRIGYASDADREKAHDNALGPVERFKTTKTIYGGGKQNGGFADTHSQQGRWPANLCHDGSDEVIAAFPGEAGAKAPVHTRNGDKFRNTYGAFAGNVDEEGSTFRGDSGSAARFFYCAKASQAERNGSQHPTIKPVALMQWLVRLVTPPMGLVLDPFAGTGTTGHAALLEGMRAVLIEREAAYAADIKTRLTAAMRELRSP